MNNKNVSVVAINGVIEHMKNAFIAKLDDDSNKILEQFNDLTAKGILTSANIDSLVGEIKGKVDALQNSFDQTSARIRVNMASSSDTIAAGLKNIESHMQ